eukprot:11202900-Lingulodinium_polyedra.AAC.1
MAQPLTSQQLSASEDGMSGQGARAAAMQRVHRGAQTSGLSPSGERHNLKASDAAKCHPQA